MGVSTHLSHPLVIYVLINTIIIGASPEKLPVQQDSKIDINLTVLKVLR